jgi:hypothetical protein
VRCGAGLLAAEDTRLATTAVAAIARRPQYSQPLLRSTTRPMCGWEGGKDAAKCPKWSLPHASDRSASYDERFGQGVRSGEGRTEFLTPLCELAPVVPCRMKWCYRRGMAGAIFVRLMIDDAI